MFKYAAAVLLAVSSVSATTIDDSVYLLVGQAMGDINLGMCLGFQFDTSD